MKYARMFVCAVVMVCACSFSASAEAKRMELTDIHARTIVVDAISHDGKSLKAIRVSDKAEVLIPFTLLIPAVQERVKELLYAGETFTNGIGQKIIWVKSGSFWMGAKPIDVEGLSFEERVKAENSNEASGRKVELSGYYLSATEVTQEQYFKVLGKHPSKFGPGANLPVEQVSWNDAVAFCKKLTEQEKAAGRLPEGFAYTLPTEAEWEYACRAGTEGDYAGDLNKMAWFKDNSGGKTHPVGKKKPNAWGFYDMHGNVWERCLDWYGSYEGLGTKDPTGNATGSNRVIRGGGWSGGASGCRSAYRYRDAPGYRHSFQGFRVALSSRREP